LCFILAFYASVNKITPQFLHSADRDIIGIGVGMDMRSSIKLLVLAVMINLGGWGLLLVAGYGIGTLAGIW